MDKYISLLSRCYADLHARGCAFTQTRLTYVGQRIRTALVLNGIVGIIALTGCSLSDLVKVDTPNPSLSPEQISTAAGALGLYSGTLGLLNSVYGAKNGDVIISGVLTDEFQDTSSVSGLRTIDARQSYGESQAGKFVYTGLQQVGTQGLQAVAAMRRFPEKIPTALIGRVYAIVGYSELLLAERFCSGVPVAVIPPGGGEVTYSAGLSTLELLERSVAHFDTALSLIGTDILRFRYLAQVGKGRALMGLNRYHEAKLAVSNVPTDFVYNAEFSVADTNAIRPQTGGALFTSKVSEGGTGIDWFTAQDPRVPMKDTIRGTVRTSKYLTATSPIVIADGIEARLIEAESLLEDNNPEWLNTLNTLRARIKLAGGTRALADTVNPPTVSERVDLLFRERALWLYATGHRHGDLRRLVRQYRRDVATVFPSGLYTPQYLNAPLTYNNTVALTLPLTGNTNPHFNGCLDTNA